MIFRRTNWTIIVILQISYQDYNTNIGLYTTHDIWQICYQILIRYAYAKDNATLTLFNISANKSICIMYVQE